MFNMSVSSHKGAKRRTNGCKPNGGDGANVSRAQRGQEDTVLSLQALEDLLGPEVTAQLRSKLSQKIGAKAC